MFRMLYSFFWVILRHLNFMYRCFETLCRFHLHRWCEQEFSLLTPPMKMEPTECFETSAHKIQMPENHPKERIQQNWICCPTQTVHGQTVNPSGLRYFQTNYLQLGPFWSSQFRKYIALRHITPHNRRSRYSIITSTTYLQNVCQML